MTQLRLVCNDYFRGVGWLVFAGILLGVLLPMALLGWLGVIDMSRGASGMFATVATIGIGVMSLVLGIRVRWGWAELSFDDDAITVTHGVARGASRVERISRPPRGVPIGAIVDELPLGRGVVAHYLVVHDGVRPTPIEIGKQLRVDKPRLAEVAAAVERWGRGEPPLPAA